MAVVSERHAVGLNQVREQENLVVLQGFVLRAPHSDVQTRTGKAWVRLDLRNRHPGAKGGKWEGKVFENAIPVYVNGDHMMGVARRLEKGDEVCVIGALTSMRAKMTSAGGLTERERVAVYRPASVAVTARSLTVIATAEERFGGPYVVGHVGGGGAVDGGGGVGEGKKAKASTGRLVSRRVLDDVGEEMEG
jgi:hypothetical protein